MLYLYIGERDAARTQMRKDMKHSAEALRITDAHTPEDLNAALRGGGMFGGGDLILENLSSDATLFALFLERIEELAQRADGVYVYEEKLLADQKKKIEKHAAQTKNFAKPKVARDTSIFTVSNALRKADKKALWVAYMREIQKGNAPEAIHGVLFWVAKDMMLKSPSARARALLSDLAEIPHTARRRGEALEYALERFVLSQ